MWLGAAAPTDQTQVLRSHAYCLPPAARLHTREKNSGGGAGATRSMLTVLHLITGLETGGAQRALSRLVAPTDRGRVHSIVVSMTDAGALGPVIAAAGVDVRTLELPSAIPTPNGVLRLARM